MGIFYNNSYENGYLNEGVTALALAPFGIALGVTAAALVPVVIDEKFGKHIAISSKKLNYSPKNGYKDEKAALVGYCYYNKGMRQAVKNTLIISKDNEKDLDDKVYVYTFKSNCCCC